MAGHYGVEKVTVQRLEVVKIDEVRNIVYLGGAIPGHNNGYVVLHNTVKNERAIADKPGLVVKNAAAKAMVKAKK